MTSSLITLILAVIAVIGFFFTVSDRIRSRRERAEAKDAAAIRKAVEEAVAKQKQVDAAQLQAATGASEALHQQLIERTDDLRRAEGDREFYRDQLFRLLAERGQVPPAAPSETAAPTE